MTLLNDNGLIKWFYEHGFGIWIKFCWHSVDAVSLWSTFFYYSHCIVFQVLLLLLNVKLYPLHFLSIFLSLSILLAFFTNGDLPFLSIFLASFWFTPEKFCGMIRIFHNFCSNMDKKGETGINSCCCLDIRVAIASTFATFSDLSNEQNATTLFLLNICS